MTLELRQKQCKSCSSRRWCMPRPPTQGQPSKSATQDASVLAHIVEVWQFDLHSPVGLIATQLGNTPCTLQSHSMCPRSSPLGKSPAKCALGKPGFLPTVQQHKLIYRSKYPKTTPQQGSVRGLNHARASAQVVGRGQTGHTS